jgi:hypothetical protein
MQLLSAHKHCGRTDAVVLGLSSVVDKLSLTQLKHHHLRLTHNRQHFGPLGKELVGPLPVAMLPNTYLGQETSRLAPSIGCILHDSVKPWCEHLQYQLQQDPLAVCPQSQQQLASTAANEQVSCCRLERAIQT